MSCKKKEGDVLLLGGREEGEREREREKSDCLLRVDLVGWGVARLSGEG